MKPHKKIEALVDRLLLEKEIGPTIADLNLVAVREFGDEASDETELEYRWQVKWRGNEKLEWGVQGRNDEVEVAEPRGHVGKRDHLSTGRRRGFGGMTRRSTRHEQTRRLQPGHASEGLAPSLPGPCDKHRAVGHRS